MGFKLSGAMPRGIDYTLKDVGVMPFDLPDQRPADPNIEPRSIAPTLQPWPVAVGKVGQVGGNGSGLYGMTGAQTLVLCAGVFALVLLLRKQAG